MTGDERSRQFEKDMNAILNWGACGVFAFGLIVLSCVLLILAKLFDLI